VQGILFVLGRRLGANANAQWRDAIAWRRYAITAITAKQRQ